MSFWSSVWYGIVVFFSYIWSLFLIWGGILLAPFIQPSLLWILVPVWLSWFFAEFFQEKKSTSFGNAISNGVVPLWIGIDWTRFLVDGLIDKTLIFNFNIFIKFVICLLVFLYGMFIIIMGIQAVSFTRYFGRIREVTYILVMFTPIIYGVVDISFNVIISMILFFPLFYYTIEIIDYYVPDPESMKEDGNSGNNGNNSYNNF
jgi:hypothetical protein